MLDDEVELRAAEAGIVLSVVLRLFYYQRLNRILCELIFSELAQTHVHQVGDAIQPSLPLSSPSPLAFNLSQHQGLFK